MKPVKIDRNVANAVRRIVKLAVLAPLLILPAACAIDPGYGYGAYGQDGYNGPSVGIGIDYYGGGGYDYGGWGGNYRSGPPRGGPRASGGGDRGGHAYRAAPPERGMPSLPSGGRGGRGGGGGGGGRR